MTLKSGKKYGKFPNMETVKVDNAKRVRLPDAKPGQVLAYELSGNSFMLTPVKPAREEAPLVKMVKGKDGYLQFPAGTKISRKRVREAIRKDRDAQ